MGVGIGHCRGPRGVMAMGEERMTAHYKEDFFKKFADGSLRSAEVVVPLVLELARPASVIDFGCGVGTWLSVFRAHGIADILGLDGAYVKKGLLRIPEDRFVALELEKPVRMGRTFDLVVSLEAAEHLRPECAETFVGSLVAHGPLILFSAAVPLQSGEHHVNEQWPEYWAARFRERGYEAIDCIRRKIWQDARVEWWYAQNIMLFAEREYLERNPLLKKEFEKTASSMLSVVHPRNYLFQIAWRSDPRTMTLSQVAVALPGLMKKYVRRKLKRLFNW